MGNSINPKIPETHHEYFEFELSEADRAILISFVASYLRFKCLELAMEKFAPITTEKVLERVIERAEGLFKFIQGSPEDDDE